MLEELLKHDKLGSREELLFFLFDAVVSSHKIPLSDLQKYCSSYVFAGTRSFLGVVKLCQFISFIKLVDEKIELDRSCFDPTSFQRESYLNQFHLFEHLIQSLIQEKAINQIFNENNLKFSRELNRYYIIENKLSSRFFPLRNFLLSTGFFERENDVANHLLIKRAFTDGVKENIIDRTFLKKDSVKKITLEQLKKGLEQKEKAGQIAELKALEFEYKRLEGHPDITKIGILSQSFVNAGYDIESFDDSDSVALDRFIEVKSFDTEICFYWSKNEIEKAKELGEKYFIYLFDRGRFQDRDYQPIRIQNPYKRIFDSELWRKEAETWRLILKD